MMASQLDLSFIPTSPEQTRRWDREWLHYFFTEDPKQHMLAYDEFGPPASFAGKSAEDVYQTKLFAELCALAVWVRGDVLRKVETCLRSVVVAGFLASSWARSANDTWGWTTRSFALSIARLTSPPQCSYAHLSDSETINSMAGTMDLMLGRFFFIHQNYASALWVLRLASILLADGGLVAADFWLSNRATCPGRRLPGRS